MNEWTIAGWQEIAVIAGVAATLSAALGALIKGKVDHANAEAAASDRLIRLIETEADKRVDVVRAEFELKIREMELAHKQELDDLRCDFEREIDAIRSSVHLACEVEGCSGRVVTSKRHPRRGRVAE